MSHQCLYEADSRAWAVDRRDDRLRHGQRIRLRRALLLGLRHVDATLTEGLQLVHVRTRTEAAPGARHDDHAHVSGGRALGECGEVRALELLRPRVQALRAVQRQHRHAVAHLFQHDLAHDHSSRRVRAEPIGR
jgi:hypothetical protein